VSRGQWAICGRRPGAEASSLACPLDFAISLNVSAFLRLVFALLHVVFASLHVVLASLHVVLASLHVVLASLSVDLVSPQAVLASPEVAGTSSHIADGCPQLILPVLYVVASSMKVAVSLRKARGAARDVVLASMTRKPANRTVALQSIPAISPLVTIANDVYARAFKVPRSLSLSTI
jgi:hypothetical protein